jgi:hypothetical protein
MAIRPKALFEPVQKNYYEKTDEVFDIERCGDRGKASPGIAARQLGLVSGPRRSKGRGGETKPTQAKTQPVRRP